MEKILAERLKAANVPAMVVTMGGDGAVYAEADGESGFCPAQKVQVKDTTGAGDAFCAGVSAGLTYGKRLARQLKSVRVLLHPSSHHRKMSALASARKSSASRHKRGQK